MAEDEKSLYVRKSVDSLSNMTDIPTKRIQGVFAKVNFGEIAREEEANYNRAVDAHFARKRQQEIEDQNNSE
jgi:hypothetical protein